MQPRPPLRDLDPREFVRPGPPAPRCAAPQSAAADCPPMLAIARLALLLGAQIERLETDVRRWARLVRGARPPSRE